MARKKESLSYIHSDLRALAVSLSDLKLDPQNARQHSAENVNAIAVSLKKFGQRKPVVANRSTGFIEAGNGTLQAARSLGWTRLAVLWVEDDPQSAAGFALADNRTAEMAAWDQAKLDLLLAEMRDTGQDELYNALLLAELETAIENADGAEDNSVDAVQQIVADQWKIVVDCTSEEDQKAFYERMQSEDRKCRLLTL